MALTYKWDNDLRLETERMIIRPVYTEDAPMIYASILETLPQLEEWMPWASADIKLSDTQAFCEASIKSRHKGTDLILIGTDKQTGDHILNTGLHICDAGVPSFMIGYWCRAAKQGQGYVTEAVNAQANYAFTTLRARRIQITCDADNTKSASVPPRCGFSLEGTMYNDALKHNTGELRHTQVYAKIR